MRLEVVDVLLNIAVYTVLADMVRLIPRGFLHGFVTLTDDVEFLYKADGLYNAQADRNVLWSDPKLAVDWGVENPIVSEKDKHAPLLKDSDIDFTYGGNDR